MVAVLTLQTYIERLFGVNNVEHLFFTFQEWSTLVEILFSFLSRRGISETVVDINNKFEQKTSMT